LAKYLADESPDPDADDAAQDPTVVTRAHVESFQAWMIETRSPSTALNKHKSLQQFFKYLLEEDRSTTHRRGHEHRRRQPPPRPRQQPPAGPTRPHLMTLPGPWPRRRFPVLLADKSLLLPWRVLPLVQEKAYS
jgi:hypothetical protein